MSYRQSVWWEIGDFVASGSGKFLETISGFVGLGKSEKEVDINLDTLDTLEAPDSNLNLNNEGIFHSLQASDFGYLTPRGDDVHKATLGNMLFLTPEERKLGLYIGNEWDYRPRVSHYLPPLDMAVLERRIIPDFDRPVRPISYMERAKELVRTRNCLLPDPQHLIEMRERHRAEPKYSFFSILIKAFATSRMLPKEGITLVFAGAPIAAMGARQDSFVTLNSIPIDSPIERILEDGWSAGHVGVDDLMQKHEYILILPPFQERRRGERE